ncbi:MIP18 family protein [Spathaspora sp. JA1]|nr:MIP18 family protein [Spathaspora sp. JA1]
MENPINANPTILSISQLPTRKQTTPSQATNTLSSLSLLTPDDDYSSDEEDDPVDPQEIFDLISTISDPEHPLTLGQLAVVNLQDISITQSNNLTEILIKITPTITHCSLATLIGLGIKIRLIRSLSDKYRIRLLIKEGSHQSELQVNKQLNDKERIAAACENEQLVEVISRMLGTCN